MAYLAPLLALAFILLVARLLLKQYYPHAVLLIAGLVMLSLALLGGLALPELKQATGFVGFDLFRLVKESFGKTNMGVGLMIMAIGGFVAYADQIGASDALVHVAMKPLSLLKKFPHLTAVMVLPIGQLLFVCIPSAAGLGLLLMATIFPILVNLGVSRLSAVSVITACTAFGIGPASAITASATGIAQEETIFYFLQHQIPLVIPTSLALMVSYYFVNRYFDGKATAEEMRPVKPETERVLTAPLFYAIIPVMPLILLIVFSEIFLPVQLDTTTAMIISLFVALVFELIRKRDLKAVLQSLTIFWEGMGNIFKSVVTLIIAADIFSKGLIALGFIDGLVAVSQGLGLGAAGIGIVMTIMIFLASMLMGSGNAAFFAFAPLVPNIATQLGSSSTSIILPMNLAASMGRTVSPVAGVLIATAEIAGVSTFAIVKRNLIPFGVGLGVMLLLHFL